MSTRSQIKVIANKKSVMLYHHYDGYPEGVGFCLMKLMGKYKNYDCVRASEIVTDMIKRGNFEVTFGKHSDIEYYYEMNFDKECVVCKEVDNWGEKMNTIRVIKLEYDEEKDVNVEEQLFKQEA